MSRISALAAHGTSLTDPRRAMDIIEEIRLDPSSWMNSKGSPLSSSRQALPAACQWSILSTSILPLWGPLHCTCQISLICYKCRDSDSSNTEHNSVLFGSSALLPCCMNHKMPYTWVTFSPAYCACEKCWPKSRVHVPPTCASF